jgi:single-stranded-DNA-specific exonuclease
MTSVLGVSTSILGQPWRWRALAADARAGWGADDLVTQLLLARGVPRDGLDHHRAPSIRTFMPDPSSFRDMDRAAARLADAVLGGEKIAIFGDYDVDGATSAALLTLILRDLGVDPRIYIPDRMTEGYGPSGPAMVRLAQEGASLIVTVDCGAQAFDALLAARDAGVDVIVADHHQCASAHPHAHAFVNPNRLDEEGGREHGHLAAVGVCFLLAAALIRELRARGVFAGRAEPRLLDHLDLVALGTVADVAQLRGLNRAFVAQGLKVMAQRRNPGLAALIDVARLSKPPSATDIGFALGPAHQCGRAGRTGRSRCPAAHHRRSDRGASPGRGARCAQCGPPLHRGRRAGGSRGAGRGRRPGSRRRGTRLASRRDRHRRGPTQGEAGPPGHRDRGRRTWRG